PALHEPRTGPGAARRGRSPQRHLLPRRDPLRTPHAPVFTGQDRQELLRQITLEEPRPPRRLNPEIPVDLETIVLKAMSKDPESRYATARDLADDLRRYLDLKPIHARRPSPWAHLMKWSRRHAAAVIAALVLSLVAVVGLSVATLLIWKAQTRAEQAYQSEAQLRRKARKAVDEMYGQVAEQLVNKKLEPDAIRRNLLERALSYY